MHTTAVFNRVCVDVGGGMGESENLLHTGLYEAVQESYKGWSCEISTHMYGDCANVHLTLKCGKVLASVGRYRAGMKMDDFYKQMIGELK